MKYTLSSVMTNSTEAVQPGSVVGYRFHPTDEELVNHFLKRKTLCHDDDYPPIPEIKVCDYEPWDLPGLVNPNSEDQVWYFFCLRDYKYLHSRRSNRTTNAGYWKPTGKSRKVISKRNKKEIGTKRSLVFYLKREKTKPVRTKWIMHEYECALNSSMATPGNFVLCKLKSKSDEKINQGQPINMVLASDIKSHYLSEMSAMSNYDEGEWDCLAGFNCENRNLEELSNNSAGDEDKSRYYLGSSELGDQEHPNEMAAMSTSVSGKLSCLTWDFEGQNPHQKIDISASGEGAWSAHVPSPSDASTSNSAAVENNAAESDPLLSYINGLELEELQELDQEDNYSCAIYQPPMSPGDSGSYTSFDVSGPADGIGSAEMGWVNELWPMCPSTYS